MYDSKRGTLRGVYTVKKARVIEIRTTSRHNTARSGTSGNPLNVL